MTPHTAKRDSTTRRSAARRTAAIVGGVAIAIYLISILEVVLKR
ncbi:MAG TPA: hypothetical protein VGC30_06955 [Dokdonella sp.]